MQVSTPAESLGILGAAADAICSMEKIECHPYLTQKNLISFCQSRSVSVTAYRPLGGPSEGVPLRDRPVVQMMARKHGKSSAQILIRFQIQRNVIVIPKSINPQRILENIQEKQDVTDLLGLDRSVRLAAFPIAGSHKDYPFRAER